MAPLPVVAALAEVVRDLPGARLQVNVHHDVAVVLHRQRNRALLDLYADRVPVGQPGVAYELDEAARAVAAMLDFAAVAVEDAVLEVGAGQSRTLDQQQLVRADAEVASQRQQRKRSNDSGLQ